MVPGVFGFRARRPDIDTRLVADRFARDLRLYDWQRSAVLATTDPTVWLGLAWNDLAPMARGATHFADAHVTCVLDGYIMRTREDCGATSALAQCSYAEAAVIAYRRFGGDFASRLEGPFSLILHDDRDGCLYGVTERHGLSMLYRYDGPEGVCFCSVLGPLARGDLFPAQFDPAAVATLLGHTHLFFRQTLLRGVVPQDSATVAISRPGAAACTTAKYWHYGWEGPRDNASLTRKIDELCDALVASAGRIVALPGRHGASLSGGMDSRLMVGLARRHDATFTTWTFGTPESPDRHIAAEIAAKLGLENHTFEPTPANIPAHASNYATMLNANGPLQNAFSLDRCHAFRGAIDAMYNGYRGGVILGKTIAGLTDRHRLRWWRGRLHLGTPVVSPNLEDARDTQRMTEYYRAIMHHAPLRIADWAVAPEPSLDEMFAAAVAGPLAATPPEYQVEQWTEDFGGGRLYALCAILADRHFFADASLFYDYDVRDRCFAIDPADRRGNKTYRAVLVRLLPDLAKIIYANTGLPADQGGLTLTASRVVRELVGRRIERSAGARPQNWLLAPEIAEFCGDVIHSRSFSSRSWWHADVIVRDFDACLKGDSSLIWDLWNAVTLELFAQRWH